MVLVEIAFPSGYEPSSSDNIRVPPDNDWEAFNKKYGSRTPDRTEMDHGHLVLYYDKVI